MSLFITNMFNVHDFFSNNSPFPIEENDVTAYEDRSVFVEEILSHVEPSYKELCSRILSGEPVSFAQGWQDWMIYHNYFRDREWGNGFYLDIGTNDATVISNTLFFDKCLGWQGICAEPQKGYHEKIKEKRGCRLLPNCVLGTSKIVTQTSGGVGANFQEVASNNTAGALQCLGIQEIARDFDFNEIDIVNLDIEGAEAEVLRCWPFDEVKVKMFLVETDKHSLNVVDFFFHQKGYVNADTFTNVARNGNTYFIDNLYVKRTEQFMTPPVNSFECTPEIKEHMSGWCYPYSHRVDNSDWFGEC